MQQNNQSNCEMMNPTKRKDGNPTAHSDGTISFYDSFRCMWSRGPAEMYIGDRYDPDLDRNQGKSYVEKMRKAAVRAMKMSGKR